MSIRHIMSDSTSADVRVRPARRDDRPRMLELWERSVRATHHFLEEEDIETLRPLVAEELAGDAVDWWVLVTADHVIGVIGFAHDAIEALFLDPRHQREGGGRRLVGHAESLTRGALTVDVNEQNGAAVSFYEALGFSVVGRSAEDAGGRPFPIVHMRRGPTLTLSRDQS
jgi:putative acetyltransferase